jgi:hypothetical protein
MIKCFTYFPVQIVLVILLNSTFIYKTSAQNITYRLTSIDSLITRTEDDIHLDVNGEICSIVHLFTDLERVKFYSNLGVEKVIKTDSGYKIWLPNRSNLLKFIIPGLPLSEYDLPDSPYKYSIYSIVLEITEYQRIIYNDTIPPILSFTSTPDNARIFLNDRFSGRSPLVIENPDFSEFKYSLKKTGFKSFTSNDTYNLQPKKYLITLPDLRKTKRYFLTLYLRSDQVYKRGDDLVNDIDRFPVFGLMFGVFGKTGAYGSLGFTSVIRNDYFSSSYTSSSYTHDQQVKKFKICLGISQQIGNPVFVYAGPGYSYRYYWNKENDDLITKAGSIDMNAGLIFRIGWYSLLQIDYSVSLNKPYMSLGVGLGFNLPNKPKDLKQSR